MLKKILLALLALLIAGFGYLQLILVPSIDAYMNGCQSGPILKLVIVLRACTTRSISPTCTLTA